MKLRLRHNSIRLRLLRGEVDRLAETGSVSERIEFPGGAGLEYSIQSGEDVNEMGAVLDGGRINVSIPASAVREWSGSEAVSLGTTVPCPGGITLTVLVEKDFACLDRKDDPDNSEAFPNPGARC